MNPYQFLALWMLIQFYGTHRALGWADVPSTLFMVTVFCYEAWLAIRPFWNAMIKRSERGE